MLRFYILFFVFNLKNSVLRNKHGYGWWWSSLIFFKYLFSKTTVGNPPTRFTFIMIRVPKETLALINLELPWTLRLQQAAHSFSTKPSMSSSGKLMNRRIHIARYPKCSNRKIVVANERCKFSQTADFFQKKEKKIGNLPKKFLKQIIRNNIFGGE